MAFTETWPTPQDAIATGQDQPWNEHTGDWDAETVNGTPACVLKTTDSWSLARCETALATVDHSFECPVSFPGGVPSDNLAPGVAVRLHPSAFTCYGLYLLGDSTLVLVKFSVGTPSTLDSEIVAAVANDVWYGLRLEAEDIAGPAVRLRCYFQDVLMFTFDDSSSPLTTGMKGGLIGYTNIAGDIAHGAVAAAELGIDHFTVETADGEPLHSQKPGVAFDALITARDAGGGIVTDFTDTVDVSATGATLAVGGGTTGAFVAGQKTVSLRIDALEEAVTINVEDTDTGLVTGQSAEISVWDLAVTAAGDATWTMPVGATHADVHVSEFPNFAASDAVPRSIDTLASDLGVSMIAKDQYLTVHHALNHTAGYGRAEAPGAAFSYGDISGGALGGMLTKRAWGGSGADADNTANDVAAERFAPLQFQDVAGDLFVGTSKLNISISPRDFARIGWLWANYGIWNGQRIIPAAYFDFARHRVDPAVPRTAGTDPAGNYLGLTAIGAGGEDQVGIGPGMLALAWWFNGVHGLGSSETPWPHVPGDTFIADGAFGNHLVIVIRSLAIVIAVRNADHTSTDLGTSSAWNLMLKKIQDAVTNGPNGGVPSYAAEFPGASWTTATDTEAGLDTSDLDDLIADWDALKAYAIVRRGRLVRSGGASTTPADWASATKPVVSTLFGIAVGLHTFVGRLGDVEAYQLPNLVTGRQYYARLVFRNGSGVMFESNEVAITAAPLAFEVPIDVITRGGWTDTVGVATDAGVLAAGQHYEAPDARSPAGPTTSDVLEYEVTVPDNASHLLYGLHKRVEGAGRTVDFTVQLRSADGSVLHDEWEHLDVGEVTELYRQDISALTLGATVMVRIIPNSS